jgi:hypothetical protein
MQFGDTADYKSALQGNGGLPGSFSFKLAMWV